MFTSLQAPNTNLILVLFCFGDELVSVLLAQRPTDVVQTVAFIHRHGEGIGGIGPELFQCFANFEVAFGLDATSVRNMCFDGDCHGFSRGSLLRGGDHTQIRQQNNSSDNQDDVGHDLDQTVQIIEPVLGDSGFVTEVFQTFLKVVTALFETFQIVLTVTMTERFTEPFSIMDPLFVQGCSALR